MDNYIQGVIEQNIQPKGKYFMSSMKPWLKSEIDSLVDFEMNVHEVTYLKNKYKSLVGRKLYYESLISAKYDDIQLSLDPLFDFEAGKETMASKLSWVNTRGAVFNGSISNKVFLNISIYENQAALPSWMDSYSRKWGIIPGETRFWDFGNNSLDYSYTTAYLCYQPSKYFNFTLGQDKNFIGDGYRSVILSDVSAPYPFLKLSANLKKFKYTAIYAQMIEPHSMTYKSFGFDRRWVITHYLQVMLWKKLELGFFESLVYQNADSTGYRGFDFHYANPLAILRSLEFDNNTADNALLGFTFNFHANESFNFYGQLLLDEFKLHELIKNTGWWGNKYAIQAGISGWNLFHVPALNARIEYNQAQPYTYSHWSILDCYSNYAQPLAHPLGANFREIIGIVSYKYKNWYATFKTNAAMYGLDEDNKNWGQNIFLSYDTREQDFGNKIGQGLKTHLTLVNGSLAYLLNRKTNMRIEGGLEYRGQVNSVSKEKTLLFHVGIKTGLRNFYNDF